MSLLKEKHNIEIAQRQDIRIDVFGINHFTFVNKATYKNLDLMPLYHDYACQFRNCGDERGFLEEHEIYFKSAQKVAFDLYHKFGTIAAAGDRHLAEFTPYWYLTDGNPFPQWKYHLTPVDFRVKRQIEQDNTSKKYAKGELPVKISTSDEEGVSQMKAILGINPYVTNVNLPNVGQISWLPLGNVVETNAYFADDRVIPVITEDCNDGIKNLVKAISETQENFVSAFFKKDKKALLAAFCSDPMVRTLSFENAQKMFQEMIENTKEYLPEWLLQS